MKFSFGKKQVFYALLVLALIFSALAVMFVFPLFQNGGEDIPPYAEAGSNENDASSNETECYILYVDGKAVASALTKSELENAVDKVALELAKKQYSLSDTYEIINKTEYKHSVLSKDSLTADIESAVGEHISVYGVVNKEVVSELEYKTVYRDNAELSEGNESVITEGKNGSLSEGYKLFYADGKLSHSQTVYSNVTLEPVNEVIERGVKAPNKQFTSLAMFVMPYNGGISSEYGTRYLGSSNFHGGVDIAAKVAGENCYGEPILASGNGTVIQAGYSGGFGNLVVIQHPNGIRTYYAHMSKITVKVGQQVTQGFQIGKIGNTGNSLGPHVHFEVRVPDENGNYVRVDPKYYIINYDSYKRK